MSDKIAQPQVVIMCKAPVLGRVKTRLMMKFSAQQATDLHRAMACTVIERAKRLFEYIDLAVDDINHVFFTPFNLPIVAQGEGDLGARMCRYMQNYFAQNDNPVLFLGTDSPHMSDQRLRDAVLGLKDHDVVLGAVEDGGYDLIAMNHAYARLFEGIDWGSEKVLSQTLSVIQDMNITCHVLEASFDVDTPEMLERAERSGWDYKKLI